MELPTVCDLCRRLRPDGGLTLAIDTAYAFCLDRSACVAAGGAPCPDCGHTEIHHYEAEESVTGFECSGGQWEVAECSCITPPTQIDNLT